MSTYGFTLLGFLIAIGALDAYANVPSCSTDPKRSETLPSKVEFPTVLKDILELRDLKNRVVVSKISTELETRLSEVFLADPKTISKLQQFYSLLFFIGKYKTLDERRVDFDPNTVRSLLLSSKVFSSPEIPSQVSQVRLFWSPYYKRANYEVDFKDREVRLSLNNGKGFASFAEGLCQVAEHLVFYGGFSFDLVQTSDANIFASDFKNVDIFGKFGSRGVVDVDINYISLKSVEFIKGSPLGIVRAKVSKREFEINSHSWLLKMVSKLVTDKSTQAIDW